MDNKRIVGTIDKRIITAGKKLRDVEYTVRQLSDKLNISERYIRRALVQIRHAPHRKDESGHIIINGKRLYEWAVDYIEREIQEKKEKTPLKENEFYCVSCRQRVKGTDVHFSSDGFNDFLKGICPVCGHKINKYLKGKNGKKDL